jgi:hypothetical protein
MLDFDNTIAIVRLCVNAGRADLIEDALFDRPSVSDLRAKIEAERPTRSPAAPVSRSLFGAGPTPQQADALAAAIKRRFEAETKRT